MTKRARDKVSVSKKRVTGVLFSPGLQSNLTAPSQSSQSNLTAPIASFSPALSQDKTVSTAGVDEAVYMHTSSSSSSFAPPSILLSTSNAASKPTSTTSSTGKRPAVSTMERGLPLSYEQEQRVEFAAYDSISSNHRNRIASLLPSTSMDVSSTHGKTKTQGLGPGLTARGQGLGSFQPDNLSTHMTMASSTTFPGPSSSPGMDANRLHPFATTAISHTSDVPSSSSQQRMNYFESQSPMIALSQLPNPNDFLEELYSPPPPSGGVTPSSTILPPSISSTEQSHQRGLPFNSAGKQRFGFHSGGGGGSGVMHSGGGAAIGQFHDVTLHSGGVYDPSQRGVPTNTELRGSLD